jgi:hypothetical protein
MAIENARLETTQKDVLVVPAGKTFAITNILVCNTDNSNAASFDMHFIKATQDINNKLTIVVRNLELPPEETFTFDSERIVLEEGDRLTFVARPNTGSGLTDLAVTVSYLEV